MNVLRSRLLTRDSEHAFFTAISVGMAAVVFAGFARTFFLRAWFPEAAAAAPPEPVFYLHGLLFSGWIALFVTQALLIASGRLALHRRLGVAGVVLAAMMVVTGIVAATTAAGRPGGFIGIPVPPLEFLVVPVVDIVWFATFVGVAVIRRRDAGHHKRLMLLATTTLLAAAIVRIPLPITAGNLAMSFWFTDVFVLLLLLWDFASRGRPHPVTLWAGGALIVSQPLRLLLAGTGPWLAFANWLVGTFR